MSKPIRKIAFLVAEDWYFLSHRRILAEACLAAGWQVVVAANISRHRDELEAMGCIVEPVSFRLAADRVSF